MALILNSCGGGGSSSLSQKDIILNNKTWYILKDDNLNETENNNTKIFVFESNLLKVDIYNDINFSDYNRTYTYDITDFEDDSLTLKDSNNLYECSFSNITYDETGCIEMECINSSGRDEDNLDYYMFNSKENAIKYNGECYPD